MNETLSAKKLWWVGARCASNLDVMFDRTKGTQARSFCATCPVAEICLWTAMVAEIDQPYRYGVFGGLSAAQRTRLGLDVADVEAEDRLAHALAVWSPAPRPSLEPPWSPHQNTRYRRPRKCKGCRAPIRQPRAGRPQVWCSSVCQNRATRDRAAEADRKRAEWTGLPEYAKERRRAAMRARWASLSDEQRAELAARRRRQRQLARAG